MKKRSNSIPLLSSAALLLGATVLTQPLSAAPARDNEAPVSREEFLQMQKEMASLRSELRALKAAKPSSSGENAEIAHENPVAKPSHGRLDTPAISALNREVQSLRQTVEANKAGDTKFVLTGSASTLFSAPSHGTSKFDATFSPILLWHLNDRLFFEGEVEYELNDESNSTKTNLEYAHLSYLLNDYVSIGAGKFLSPMNAFVERYEPKWINKLPDAPLAVYDGLLPESNVGAQIRGAIPVGTMRFNYAAYVSNAPSVDSNGVIGFDNFKQPASNGKAAGGRLGFLPCQYLEIGYGVQQSKVRLDDNSNPDTHYNALLQAVDLSTSMEAANGRFSILSQYAWSEVGTKEDFTYAHRRSGGYAQLSYRGKKWGNDFLNRLEGIIRVDRMTQLDLAAGTPPVAMDTYQEKRVTFGIDYWLRNSTVLKTAYELDRQSNGRQGNNTLLLSIATGF